MRRCLDAQRNARAWTLLSVFARHIPRYWRAELRRLSGHSSTSTAFIAASILLAAASPTQAAFDCLVFPEQSIELSTAERGVLEQALVRRGERIKKGQVLAVLESSVEAAAADIARLKATQEGAIRLAEARLEFAQRRYVRHRDLSAENLMSIQERDDAEAAYRQAQAELDVARENQELAKSEYRHQANQLALRSFTSPFDGVVVDQLASVGEVVDPSGNKKAVYQLAQLDPLRVQIIFPKEVFGRVDIGASVELRLEVGSNTGHAARIRTVDRLVDAASGTFVAIAELRNPSLAIPAGVRCSASIAKLEGRLAGLSSRNDSKKINTQISGAVRTAPNNSRE